MSNHPYTTAPQQADYQAPRQEYYQTSQQVPYQSPQVQDQQNRYLQDPALIHQQTDSVPAQEQYSSTGSWFNVSDHRYLKGLLLGAGVALLATNPKVQKAVVSGAVKAWTAVQGGVEEIKEQIQDAKAEISRQE